MKRFCITLTALFLLALPTQAHFIWLIPDNPYTDKPGARVVFSERPEPDSAELMKKITQTKVFVRGGDAKSQEVKYDLKGAAFVTKLTGKGPRQVEAVCQYGVFQRPGGEPMLLNYYAKTWVGIELKSEPPEFLLEGSKRLKLDIVPVKASNKGQVLFQGKPVADAEVVIMPPEGRRTKTTTDKQGHFEVPQPDKGGLFSIRARHIEQKAGTVQGKQYKEIRSYVTLTLLVPDQLGATEKREAKSVPANAEKKKAEDPAATKLLDDARQSRAEWHDFPGFTADLKVNVNGNLSKAKITVTSMGNVKLDGLEKGEIATLVSRQLRSVVGHRMASERTEPTPCAFADDNAHHPLGRKIQVLNDEFHSSYQVRDRQIIIVNRAMKDSRFTITVLKNYTTKEKKFLPAHYVVNYWDLKSDQLIRSNSFYYTWKRVGKFDLPTSALVVTATADGKLSSRSLTLSNHKLLATKASE